MSKKRRLTNFSFTHDGAHVALVSTKQGGPANGITTLVMKAADNISPEQLKEAVESLTPEQTLTLTEETTLDTIEKSVHQELLQKAVDDAVAVEKAAGATALAEVQKALDEQAIVLKAAQDKLAEFETQAVEAHAQARKDALTEAGVPADKLEALFKAYAPMDDEGFETALEVLKAQKALVDNSEMLKETGVTGAGEPDQTKVSKTAEILKAKYATKTPEAK